MEGRSLQLILIICISALCIGTPQANAQFDCAFEFDVSQFSSPSCTVGGQKKQKKKIKGLCKKKSKGPNKFLKAAAKFGKKKDKLLAKTQHKTLIKGNKAFKLNNAILAGLCPGDSLFDDLFGGDIGDFFDGILDIVIDSVTNLLASILGFAPDCDCPMECGAIHKLIKILEGIVNMWLNYEPKNENLEDKKADKEAQAAAAQVEADCVCDQWEGMYDAAVAAQCP